jgi:hypothetical protein
MTMTTMMDVLHETFAGCKYCVLVSNVGLSIVTIVTQRTPILEA